MHGRISGASNRCRDIPESARREIKILAGEVHRTGVVREIWKVVAHGDRTRSHREGSLLTVRTSSRFASWCGARATLEQRSLEPKAPKACAGAFDTEIIVVDEQEFMRRQHDQTFQVAIKLPCIIG